VNARSRAGVTGLDLPGSLKYDPGNNHPMTTSTLRKWGRSLGVVIPRDETVRKGLKAGQRVEATVEPLAPPDDFSDIAGTVTWLKSAQAYKDELRRMWGE